MNTKQDLENQLQSLRLKWKGDYPKSDLDKRWWSFKCDKTLAEQLKTQIKKIEAVIPLDTTDLTDDQMAELLK
jgi:hypothetical protein